jgi:hypothetical protein
MGMPCDFFATQKFILRVSILLQAEVVLMAKIKLGSNFASSPGENA